eukprot:jgi/Chlat1/2566/Chrsp175S02438
MPDDSSQYSSYARDISSVVEVESAASVVARPAWATRLPKAADLIYCFDASVVNVFELNDLWMAATGEPRDPHKVATALRHSFAVVAVYAPIRQASGITQQQLVGCARAISDGAFVATLCDVAVHPVYQGRGIGRAIVKRLIDHVRSRGPSSFAAYSPPSAKRFFTEIGFSLMAYKGGDRRWEAPH